MVVLLKNLFGTIVTTDASVYLLMTMEEGHHHARFRSNALHNVSPESWTSDTV